MRKIAIISDIHANIEALDAVLEDIRQNRKVDAIYCLGDVIGYGPNPIECLDKASDLCDIILMGNHEEAVLTGAFGFNPSAKEAIDWTRKQLKPKWYQGGKAKKRWKVLQSLPLSFTENEWMFVHGSPRDPTMEYILKSDTDDLFGDIPEKMKEVFLQVDRICFIGHTHTPGIITEESKWHDIEKFGYSWDCNDAQKIVCNVGSVGQPRDRDTRACYVTFTGKEIFFHRVPYDYKKTQEKIRSLSLVDNHNADRLEVGT